ncbi:MAG: tetratricopeptide repeat protein [Deltaproteobacteria bacterium]|nr:tetratricopeptide repeat protein [Deltaproteobacteria bacterium]
MDELDEELRDIKREIIESRGLIIKTNNLTNALAADLKSIGKRQQSFERRTFWNSAAANFLFVVVVLGVVKVAWDFRADTVEREVTRSQTEVKQLREELESRQRFDDERAKAESAASAFYELIRTGKKKDLVEAYESVGKEKLSRVERSFFGDEVKRARGQLSVASYHAGLDHLRAGRFQEAVNALDESLRQDDTGTHAPATRLYLAQGYRRLNRQREAIPLLVKLAEASPDPEILDDAAFLLAECLLDIQAWNDAKTALRTFIRRYPQSPFMNDARMALSDVEAKH